jgi:hypothetical protein
LNIIKISTKSSIFLQNVVYFTLQEKNLWKL